MGQGVCERDKSSGPAVWNSYIVEFRSWLLLLGCMDVTIRCNESYNAVLEILFTNTHTPTHTHRSACRSLGVYEAEVWISLTHSLPTHCSSTGSVYRLAHSHYTLLITFISVTVCVCVCMHTWWMDWEREAIGPLEMSLMPHCSHPANFNQVGHHDDGSCVLLPHHPPEVNHCLLHGSWRKK